MDRDVYRLIAAGIRPDCAHDTVRWYRQRNDEEGLERYIQSKENSREVSCR